MSDGTDDVVEVLTELIEARYSMSMDELTAAVTAAPDADSDARDIVKWHRLLVQAETALARAEDDLLAVLEDQPTEVDVDAVDLAHRVNAAVTTRDGRALVVRWLLDPAAPGKTGRQAEQPASQRRSREGPAVPTSPPARAATTPAPARGARR